MHGELQWFQLIALASMQLDVPGPPAHLFLSQAQSNIPPMSSDGEISGFDDAREELDRIAERTEWKDVTLEALQETEVIMIHSAHMAAHDSESASPSMTGSILSCQHHVVCWMFLSFRHCLSLCF